MKRRLFALSAAVLAGCGGSISLGYGWIDWGDGDQPPAVSLVAAPATAARGQSVALSAAASDDHAVLEVEFYRQDSAGTVFLGYDDHAPYAWSALVPTTAAVGSTLYFFARAIDDGGHTRDSERVAVTVQ